MTRARKATTRCPHARTRTRPRSSTSARDAVTRYAGAVTKGKVIAGRAVRLACARHLHDLTRQRTRAFPFYFDAKAAKHIVSFFPEFLTLESGDRFRLTDWQAFCLGSIFGWKRVSDGWRRFQMAYIEAGKGSGKALALDTAIPTPSGWTTMGELQRGDEVFDEAGDPCRVIAATNAIEGHPCYMVSFSDGGQIVADAEHFWRTTTLRSGRKRGDALRGVPKSEWRASGRGSCGIRTTVEIAKTLTAGASRSVHPQAKWNHRIEVAGALMLPDVDLPIPPYTLGAWLGDGDSDSARFTSAFNDAEIIQNIRSDGIAVVARTKHSETTGRFLLGSLGRTAARGSSLCARLRTSTLLKNKHIPSAYLRASERQRLALLQGLLDTDGTVGRTSGEIELTLTRQKLAAGALELIRSLGFKATMRASEAKLYGRTVGTRWRINFFAFADRPMFRLKRKAARQVRRPRTRPLSEGRMVVGCQSVPSVPVKCISVDSSSGMYLAGRELVPTHNSPLLAGVGLYGLAFDDENAAEIYSAAFDQDQASIILRGAIRMASDSPDIAEILDIGKYNIAHLESRSFFRAVSSEHRSKSGPRPSMVLIDELHEHRSGTVVNKMRAGFKGRTQPILVAITNSGHDRTSVCWSYHEHSLAVLEGTVSDEQWFAYVCQLDPCDACYADGHRQPRDGCDLCDSWTDPRVWKKANPSLDLEAPGTSTREYLQSQVDLAIAMPSEHAGLVKRLNFCCWTESHTIWIPPEQWAACRVDALPTARSVPTAAAFDMSMKIDLCGCVVAQRFDDPPQQKPETIELAENENGQAIVKYWTVGYRVALSAFAWLPEDTLIERVKTDRIPFDVWRAAGHLRATPGPVIDHHQIYDEFVQEIAPRFKPQQVGYDPYNATEFAVDLRDRAKFTVVEIGQGRKLSEYVKLFHALVRLGRILHDGNPVFAWCVANAEPKSDRYENMWLEKPSAMKRIDLAIAAVMALSLVVLLPVQRQLASRMPKIWTKAGWVPAIAPAPAEVHP